MRTNHEDESRIKIKDLELIQINMDNVNSYGTQASAT